MAVTRPTYVTREEVRAVPDVSFSARANPKIDRAIQDASDRVEGQLHRVFYNTDTTHYFDWPNFQYAYPWVLHLEKWEIADATGTVPVVTSGGTLIPAVACNFEPVNSGPPFTWLELRRDMSYSFGVGPTPQRDIGIQATYGYWTQTTRPASSPRPWRTRRARASRSRTARRPASATTSSSTASGCC